MQQSGDKFAYMMIALIIYLVGVPAATDLDLLPAAINKAIGTTAILAIGVWSLRGSGRMFPVIMSIALIAIVLNGFQVAIPGTVLYSLVQITSLAFFLLATFMSFRQIASSNAMSGNRIIGAICVYFLLGVVWSVCYELLELAVPGSFSGLDAGSALPQDPNWVYFSFVTLTTLGYGDILPLSAFARALAYMEAVFGQFYIAVLVAGLVSAYIADKQSS